MTTAGDASSKRRILDAAESLFAERGVDAVSLRAVMSAASTNVAAVHYHFGSKDALVTALIAERSHEISSRRAVLLDELEEAEQFTARELASAFVIPVVETTQDGGAEWVRFIATLINSTHPAMSQVTQGFFEQGRRFIALTERLHPDWPTARLVFRLSQAMTATLSRESVV